MIKDFMFIKSTLPKRLEVAQLALISGLIFISVHLAIKTMTLSTGQMAIWPSDGIALAMMLGRFRHRPLLIALLAETASGLPGILMGYNWVFISLLKIPDAAILLSLSLAFKNYDYKANIHRTKNILMLFSLTLIASLCVSFFQTCIVKWFFKIDFLSVYLSEAAANWVGYVLLTPIFLIMTRDGWRPASRERGLRGLGALALYAVVVCLVFGQTRFPTIFMLPLALMAVAYTTTLALVAFCLLATSLVAFYATISGVGHVSIYPGTPVEHLLVTQVILGVITASCLPIAAMMAEHSQLKQSLLAARLQAEAASQAKSNFLAVVSHEVRTPLNGILGMAQIMGAGPLDPVQAERLQIVRRSGEMLLAILNDVLDLAKIEAGKIELEVIEFDLGQTLAATVACFAPLAAVKGVRFDVDIATAEGIYRGDPTRVRQIVSNLISNALKFTEAGSVSLSATYGEGSLRLSVADTGIGIATDKLDQLFSRFFQADQSMTRRFGGTGLGLAICRDLANLMGGDIEVQSQVGAGSTFTANLPLPRIGDAQIETEDEALTGDGFDAALKVLAAEDNPTNQMVLRALLGSFGIAVTIVENGAQAVEAWEQADWNLILLDVQMPVMDGPEAARMIRIREAAEGRPRTPIIALTADTMAHQIKFHLDSGMDLHVAKPIEASDLFRKVLKASQMAATGAHKDGASSPIRSSGVAQ
jgi:signal transduction histidine kinase/FixJ family two-component response regulator